MRARGLSRREFASLGGGLLPQVGVCFCTPWRGGAEQTVCSQSAPDSQETRDRRWLCPPACHSKHTHEIKSRLSGKKRGVAGVEPASRSSVHMEEGSRVGKATHLPQPPVGGGRDYIQPGQIHVLHSLLPRDAEGTNTGPRCSRPSLVPGALGLASHSEEHLPCARDSAQGRPVAK